MVAQSEPMQMQTPPRLFGADHKPSLLGISGAAGSGKTEAGRVLAAHRWHLVKMAGPLKLMARSFFMSAGATASEAERMLDGDLKERPWAAIGGKTPRYVMQTLGTEWGRGLINDTLWVDIARDEIQRCLMAGRSVYVDDVRFGNEADMIRDLGGSILRINGRGGLSGLHVSERPLEGDITYQNDGSLAELQGFMRYVFIMESACDEWFD